VNGNRTNLGLQTPTSAVVHDAANGFGGFTSLIYNADSQDQFRLVAQLRRDFYQVPFDTNDPGTQGQFLRDANRENDSFVTFSWVRTFSPGSCSQSRPSTNYNSANYQSSLQDFPSSANENRSSKYEGGQATLSWIRDRSNLRVGFYGFSQQDEQLFWFTMPRPGASARTSILPRDIARMDRWQRSMRRSNSRRHRGSR